MAGVWWHSAARPVSTSCFPGTSTGSSPRDDFYDITTPRNYCIIPLTRYLLFCHSVSVVWGSVPHPGQRTHTKNVVDSRKHKYDNMHARMRTDRGGEVLYCTYSTLCRDFSFLNRQMWYGRRYKV